MRVLNLCAVVALLAVLWGYVSAHPDSFPGVVRLPHHLIIWGE
jgi:hypothetical protein